MVVGIQLSSLKKFTQTEADMAAALRRVAEMGCTAVQLQWHGRDIPAAAVARMLREHGLRALSVQDYTHDVLAQPDYYFSLAEACGCADLCVSGIPADEMNEAGIRRFAERIAPLGERAARAGMTLSFHPRWQELAMIGSKTALAHLLDAADASLRVLPDMNHVVRAGLSPAAFLASVAGRADMLHCKDMTDATRERSHLVPAGRGCIDWETVFPAARAAGIRYALTEQESFDGDAFTELGEGYRYLCAVNARTGT